MLNIVQIIYLLTKSSETRDLVSEYKKEKWTRTFEKEKGNVDKAYEIYTKDAYFC